MSLHLRKSIRAHAAPQSELAWPAVHSCTRAFYYYKENPAIADDYAITGGSHCEPILRNNACKWAETYREEYGKKPGEWRYDLSRDEIPHVHSSCSLYFKDESLAISAIEFYKK